MKNTLGFSSKNVCCSMAQQLSSSCLYLPHSIMIKLKYSEELLHMYVPASICRFFDGGTPLLFTNSKCYHQFSENENLRQEQAEVLGSPDSD